MGGKHKPFWRNNEFCRKISINTKKQTRTQEEEQYLRDFEELKDPTITQEEKLKRLLALAIPEEDRHIYQARYDTNMAMLEKSGLVLSEIREKTAKKPIDIGRIEQSLFTGEKAVKAQSIIEAERRLEQDRCRNAQETRTRNIIKEKRKTWKIIIQKHIKNYMK